MKTRTLRAAELAAAIGGLIFAQGTSSFAAAPAPAPPSQPALQSLIRQNINSAVQSDRAMASVQPSTPTVWVLIRRDSQRLLAESLYRRLAGVKINGVTADTAPIQIVGAGPTTDEIRYFKPGDREGAKAILQALRPELPRLKLRDLSPEFGQVAWIKPGHYELWLAPTATGAAPTGRTTGSPR